MLKRLIQFLTVLVALPVLAACTSSGAFFPPVAHTAALNAGTPAPEPQPVPEDLPPYDIPLAYAASPRDDLNRKIANAAFQYDVPLELVHHVVNRESTYNPSARNGPYWGLMQISYPTARSMGYKGEPEGLLDAETNLKYAVKYLKGAWVVSGGSHQKADNWYRNGYYYEAKRLGLLCESGLRTC